MRKLLPFFILLFFLSCSNQKQKRIEIQCKKDSDSLNLVIKTINSRLEKVKVLNDSIIKTEKIKTRGPVSANKKAEKMARISLKIDSLLR